MSEPIIKQQINNKTLNNHEPIFVVKANGDREIFDTKKLEESLSRAGANSQTIHTIINNITDSLEDGMTTHDIYIRAFKMLHGEEKPVAIRYSMKRAVMELGPSGFPFEDYVAEIFKFRGFETLTDQIVKGEYVEHEVDVVAWKDDKLIMCEAKFHNESGVKSDLKVALYVKERYDDLSTQIFEYGGKKRKLAEGWLVTNTKFSSTAIEYGKHVGPHLIMIGWNYPEHGNLHDMIVEAKLHPITCLVSLSGHAKKTLLENGIVLCKSILEKPDLLTMADVMPLEQEKVLEEIRLL